MLLRIVYGTSIQSVFCKKKNQKEESHFLLRIQFPLRTTFSLNDLLFLLVAEINIQFKNNKRYVEMKKKVRKSKNAIEPNRNY